MIAVVHLELHDSKVCERIIGRFGAPKSRVDDLIVLVASPYIRSSTLKRSTDDTVDLKGSSVEIHVKDAPLHLVQREPYPVQLIGPKHAFHLGFGDAVNTFVAAS